MSSSLTISRYSVNEHEYLAFRPNLDEKICCHFFGGDIRSIVPVQKKDEVRFVDTSLRNKLFDTSWFGSVSCCAGMLGLRYAGIFPISGSVLMIAAVVAGIFGVVRGKFRNTLPLLSYGTDVPLPDEALLEKERERIKMAKTLSDVIDTRGYSWRGCPLEKLDMTRGETQEYVRSMQVVVRKLGLLDGITGKERSPSRELFYKQVHILGSQYLKLLEKYHEDIRKCREAYHAVTRKYRAENIEKAQEEDLFRIMNAFLKAKQKYDYMFVSLKDNYKG